MEELLTIEEAARVVKMSPSWIYKAIKAGDLACIQFGRYKRVRRSALDAYITKLSRKTEGTALSGEVTSLGKPDFHSKRIQ
jgi:excisionase family DNA binding protein